MDHLEEDLDQRNVKVAKAIENKKEHITDIYNYIQKKLRTESSIKKYIFSEKTYKMNRGGQFMNMMYTEDNFCSL